MDDARFKETCAVFGLCAAGHTNDTEDSIRDSVFHHIFSHAVNILGLPTGEIAARAGLPSGGGELVERYANDRNFTPFPTVQRDLVYAVQTLI